MQTPYFSHASPLFVFHNSNAMLVLTHNCPMGALLPKLLSSRFESYSGSFWTQVEPRLQPQWWFSALLLTASKPADSPPRDGILRRPCAGCSDNTRRPPPPQHTLLRPQRMTIQFAPVSLAPAGDTTDGRCEELKHWRGGRERTREQAPSPSAMVGCVRTMSRSTV